MFQYGAPAPAPQYAAQSQPSCWANERYFNPNTRECRACSFQPSCRDQITRNRNAAASVPAYASPYPVASYAGPVPAPIHVPVAVPQSPQVTPQTQAIVRQVPPHQAGGFPAPQPYEYGWLMDPLYYALYSSPPPMVPQLGGEGFIERVAKNALRASLSSVAAEIFLATRQFIWAPRSHDEED